MRLAEFILSNGDSILSEWEVFARGIGAGQHLDKLALRDHAGQLLYATARDMESPQTAAERAQKSKGLDQPQANDALDGASESHAGSRLSLGFDLLELISEYRALRASVLKLWRDSLPAADECDIDDLTRFNESIDQSLVTAVASFTKRVDQARDMFLAILGHDLRNPLNSIAMMALMVPQLGIADAPRALECSRQITCSVAAMERMIADLLDYTRTRLGAGMPVKPVPQDLASLGRELFDEFRTAHPEREIQYRADGDLNGCWDAGRIRQAISNLLGNAIQHGAADLPVRLRLRGETSNVFVDVHNGGAPIPPGELPQLFSPLVRGSNAEHPQRNHPGSMGMGLYIAHEVVKSHGGGIDVASNTRDGTRFTIRLPREAGCCAHGSVALSDTPQ
jgi:signal transduction histidine kinase